MAAAANSAPKRDRVSFRDNVAVIVTLESGPAEQPSRNGEVEYRYFLSQDRIMWLPYDAHQALEHIGATEGSSVRITRHDDAQWSVEYVTRESPGAAALRNTTTAPASRPPVSAPRPHAVTQRREPATAASIGAPAQQQLPAMPGEEPFSTSMYTCMCAAVRVAANVEAFAQQIGRPLAFETSDIRAMATTLFINQAGGR